MKTTLILKYSSFFFNRNVNLSRNEPKIIETDDLDSVEIETLNYYISLGAIASSEGLIIEKQDILEEEQPAELKKEVDETIKEDSPVSTNEKAKEEPEEVTTTVKQKTAPKTPTKRAPTRTAKK